VIRNTSVSANISSVELRLSSSNEHDMPSICARFYLARNTPSSVEGSIPTGITFRYTCIIVMQFCSSFHSAAHQSGVSETATRKTAKHCRLWECSEHLLGRIPRQYPPGRYKYIVSQEIATTKVRVRVITSLILAYIDRRCAFNKQLLNLATLRSKYGKVSFYTLICFLK